MEYGRSFVPSTTTLPVYSKYIAKPRRMQDSLQTLRGRLQRTP